jgi:hypothetical protein
MPLDAESVKKLKSLLGKARKAELNFGLALGRDPADTALAMHLVKNKEMLFKEVRKADGVDKAKSCFGTAIVDGSLLILSCEIDPPVGAKKKCKAFFRDNKISLKVRILAPGGAEFEADDSDDEGPGEPPVAPSGDDEDQRKWQEIVDKIQPKLVATLKAGKGDLQKMKAAWGLAGEKAAGGDYDAGKKVLSALMKLMSDAAGEVKTQAEKQSGSVVSDTATGREILAELKTKVDQIKEVFGLLPGRVADGRQMIADIQQGVKDLDLDFARVGLTRLEMLLREADPLIKARSEFKMAEGRIHSRARAMAHVKADHPEFGDLAKAFHDATVDAMGKADLGDWRAARDALGAWAGALGALEKAYRQSLDEEGQYKLAELDLTSRAEPLRDFPTEGFGMADILSAYQTAVLAATDLAAKSDWAGALANVPEWRRQLEIAEAAQASYIADKQTFEDVETGLKDDLAAALKLGAVTPAMGVLCKAVRDQAPLIKPASDAKNYAVVAPLIQELATRVAALLEAHRAYDDQKSAWGVALADASARIARIEGCGALDPTLDPLKAAFDQAMDAARTKARANDYAGALVDLRDAMTRADTFFTAKDTYNEARNQVFDEARRDGADDIPDIPAAGNDDGAAIAGVEAAMQDDSSLRKSKGLQDLLQEAKAVDGLYQSVMSQADPGFAQGALAQFDTAIANCEAYQSGHKETSKSKGNREKFAQAQSLVTHYRAMIDDIRATIPALTILEGIDPAALASNEANALRAIGQIDAIKASDLCPEAKDIAEGKRRRLIANMMKGASTADQIREVAVMAGGDFQESYERQMALGPLTGTIGESRAARDHQSTRIQPPADAANVDQTRRLAQRLITDDGRLELAALYACAPEDLAGDSPSSRQTARALKRLRQDPEAIALLENIAAPAKGSPAAKMVCATLGLEAGTEVTDAQTRQAALSSLLAELRQKDVGSCFSTQVAINIHDTDPKRYLQDVSDMLSKGVITRTVNGKTVTMPIETLMSDKALETNTLKLSRGDNPDLLGSSNGGTLGDPVKLEEAPAFQATFATLGIEADDREAAMAAALQTMQSSDEFQLNQNAKALKAGVATIADRDQRDKVFKAAMALLEVDGNNVKAALEQAMAAEGVPDADPANQLAAANAARDAFDTIAAAAEFNVEPGMVVRQLVMDKVGLTEADIAKQKQYEAAAAAFASDARPDNDPGRRTDMNEVERLQDECADIRPRILEMEALKAASYDAFTGGEDNRLLRAYEYTLTALAEESSNTTRLARIQEAEADVFRDEFNLLLTDMHGNPAIDLPGPDLQDIAVTLMNRYQTLFGEGTKHAYDASIEADEVSADGNSDRGGFYLYDTRGIASAADWIRIDDSKKYQALVKGTMMLAWKEEFGDSDDPTKQEAARYMAEELGNTVASDGFVTKTIDAAKIAGGNESTRPWQVQTGGLSQNVIEVLEERTPVVAVLGDAPANSKELFTQIATQLEALWKDNDALQAAADEDAEVATINARTIGVHAFSLTPGDPKLRALLESGDVGAAIDAFQVEEQAKWDGALGAIAVTTREETKALMAEYRLPTSDPWVDFVWGRLDNGAFPQTAKGVVDASISHVSVAQRESAKAVLGGNVLRKLIPPIEPGDLQEKLEKVAARLGVAPDMVAAVTGRAKDALDTKDATKATMGDIRDEIAQAMTAEGIDASSVDQNTVNAALRDPVGIIFADTNWGNSEHRIKFAMVTNPVSGTIEMWRMNEDGSNAARMDDSVWVNKQWSTIT